VDILNIKISKNSSSTVLCFFLGNSPDSEFYMPTFRNTLFHLHKQGGVEDRTERSETSVYKIQTPGNHPEENLKHSEHGKSLKSRILF
jgi:hypothetical protein